MDKCVKVIINGVSAVQYLESVVLLKARTAGIEGVGQAIDASTVRIVVKGSDEKVQNLIDMLLADNSELDFMMEPFLASADFRGVFRIIV